MNDDDETAGYFASAETIHIIRVPSPASRDPNRKYYPTRTIAGLLSALGIPALSKSVQRQLVSYGSQFSNRRAHFAHTHARTHETHAHTCTHAAVNKHMQIHDAKERTCKCTLSVSSTVGAHGLIQ